MHHENDAARLTLHRSSHYVPIPEDGRLDGVDQDHDSGVVEEVEKERSLVLNRVGAGTLEETQHTLVKDGDVHRHAAGPEYASGNAAISLNRPCKRASDLRRQVTTEREKKAVHGGYRRRRLGPG